MIRGLTVLTCLFGTYRVKIALLSFLPTCCKELCVQIRQAVGHAAWLVPRSLKGSAALMNVAGKDGAEVKRVVKLRLPE